MVHLDFKISRTTEYQKADYIHQDRLLVRIFICMDYISFISFNSKPVSIELSPKYYE